MNTVMTSACTPHETQRSAERPCRVSPGLHDVIYGRSVIYAAPQARRHSGRRAAANPELITTDLSAQIQARGMDLGLLLASLGLRNDRLRIAARAVIYGGRRHLCVKHHLCDALPPQRRFGLLESCNVDAAQPAIMQAGRHERAGDAELLQHREIAGVADTAGRVD